AEGGRGAAEAGVPQAGVVVVQLPDGEGVRRLAGKEIVQVLFVRDLLHPEPGQEIVVKAPADVVVAAQVVLENAVLGQTGQDVQLAAEQGGVGGGHRVPGGAHGGDIVQHMALGFVGGAE